MSYTALIDSKLTLAFKMAKDLAKTAVFTATASSSFDFSSAAAVKPNKTSTSVLVIVTSTVKKQSTVTKTLMAKSSELPSLNSYDTVQLEGSEWKVGTVLKSEGAILVFEIVKET